MVTLDIVHAFKIGSVCVFDTAKKTFFYENFLSIERTSSAVARNEKPAFAKLRRAEAETEGFEPSIRFPVYTLSRRASSTARASLQDFVSKFRSNGCKNSILLQARSSLIPINSHRTSPKRCRRRTKAKTINDN